MKKKLLWLGIGVSLLLGWFLFRFFVRSPDPTITSANCEAIQIGMTEKRVEDILERRCDEWLQGKEIVGMKRWRGSDATITVFFDATGNVTIKYFETWQEEVRLELGQQWNRFFEPPRRGGKK